ncbi:MAG: hypothetical protein WCC87_14410 [Candidatus Korobacteraceae bacterium]
MRRACLLFITWAVLLCAGASDALAQTWWVQSADYGAGNQRQDVTNTVRRLVSGPNFRVNNATLGTDPAVGRDKILRIVAKDASGNVRDFSYREGQTVNAQMFAGGPNSGRPGWPGFGGGSGGPAWGGGGSGGGNNYGLRITSAMWGLGSRQQDVTNRLQNMVLNNRLSVGGSPKTMGGDPVVGVNKTLTVYYNWKGRNLSKTAAENTVLNIP